MEQLNVGFTSLIFVCLFSACQSDEQQFGVNDDFVILQNQKPVEDTLSIVERQKDSVYYWDPGSIEVSLPEGADVVSTSNDIRVVKSENHITLIGKRDWQRTQRDSLSHVFLTLRFANGDSVVRAFALQWKGIVISDSLWQKVTLSPAKVSKITMYPGESRSIQFVWSYPKQLSGLLKAEVANQATNETTPNWKNVALEKKKFTSSWIYGRNETARFRISGLKRQKEVSFAVVSMAM